MSDSRTELELTPRRDLPATPPAEPGEDAGTQALADALRSSFVVVQLLMVAVVIYFVCSGIFTVGPEEKAIILRFGAPLGDGEKALRGPGLHWAFPYPIDEVIRIPLGRFHTVRSTVGWYATTPALEAAKQEPPAGPSLNPATDGYLLTGDGNILHVRGTLRYRINEPGIRYFLDFVNASNLVQQAFNNALVLTTARYKVDDILTHDFTGYRESVRQHMEVVIARQQLGVTVDQIDLTPIPPRQLTAQFGAVLQASLAGSKVLNEARSYANQTVSRAQAQAESRKNGAQTERAQLVKFVAAEAKRFTDLLPIYRSNPTLLLQQQQTEAVKQIVTNALIDKIILPDRADGKAREVRIQLNREPQRLAPVESPKAHEDEKH
jgi:membrane protease subunit HflK